MKQYNNVNKITRSGMVAAAYIALTFAFQSVGYGEIQFRVSEILNFLAWYDPSYIPGIVIGCAISNLNSPLGLMDVFFGSLHTALALIAMSKTKNKKIASLWPAILSFIIGAEIAFAAKNIAIFIPVTASVMISEFIICSLISLPVYSKLEKNAYVYEKILNRKVCQ